MDDLTCALIQPSTRWADRGRNRQHLARLMDDAGPADLYVLPETCTTGFLGDLAGDLAGDLDRDLDNPARSDDGCEDVDWVHAEAARRGSAIAAGFAVIDGGQRFNRLVFAMPSGVSARYDKRHLFGYGGEDARYTAGSRRSRVMWRGWRFDLQICYDIRFPVWCRNDDAFEVQLFVANWPSPRVAAWTSLLQARAIENQAVVIGVNRSGTDGKGIDYPGASRVFDATGQTVLSLDEEEQVATCRLEAGALSALREQLPFLADGDQFSIGDLKPRD